MHATKIVVSEMQGYGGLKVRQLFAERIRQASESSAHHPQGQVLPLNKRSRDVAFFRVADDSSGDRLNEPGWSVALPPRWNMRVNLLDLTKVHGLAERR